MILTYIVPLGVKAVVKKLEGELAVLETELQRRDAAGEDAQETADSI
jgi:hypothetical protein